MPSDTSLGGNDEWNFFRNLRSLGNSLTNLMYLPELFDKPHLIHIENFT